MDYIMDMELNHSKMEEFIKENLSRENFGDKAH